MEQAAPLLPGAGGMAGMAGAPSKDAAVLFGGRRLNGAMKERAAAEGRAADVQEMKNSALLVVTPAFVFMISLFVVYKLYVYSVIWTFVYFIVLAQASVFTWRQTHTELHRQNAILALLALGAAFVIGLQLYYCHWVYYYRYRDLPRHTNVRGSQHADAFNDSGMLEFSADSRVDVARAVGYQSVTLGKIMCVAPVVDSMTTSVDPISFFAVGEDCCGWRGEFSCGDAGDEAAKFGLLELDAGALTVSPLLAALVDDPALRQGYEEALQLDQAVFGLPLARRTRFLRWTSEPITLQDDYWRAGFWRATLWSVAVIAVSSAYARVERQRAASGRLTAADMLTLHSKPHYLSAVGQQL